MKRHEHLRLSEGLEEVDILSNIMPEAIDLQIPRNQADRERSIHSEERLPATPDP